MKSRFIFLALAALTSSAAMAQSVTFVSRAAVVGVQPVYSQAQVGERKDCVDVLTSGQNTSGGGALLGAVIGGVVGNRFGGGTGRALATGAGVMGGAIIGNSMEASRQGERPATRVECRSVPVYGSSLTGYDVTYEIDGFQGTTHMVDAPGQYISVEMRVTPLHTAPRRQY